MSSELAGTFERGAYLSSDYELRVTLRCLADDLRVTHSSDFELERLYRSIDIITAFINQRAQNPTSTRQVTLSAGREVWVLGYGHSHRGATWHEHAQRVLWLCAYGWHRSGQDDDAFKHFRRLDAEGTLFPTADDYEWLFAERDNRFANLAPSDAARLLTAARAKPGLAVEGFIGGMHGVAVTVEVADDLEAVWIAVDSATFPTDWLGTLFAAFAPTVPFGEWAFPFDTFPSRPLRPGEWSAVWHHSLTE